MKQVLDNSKHPVIAGETSHFYEDKYLLSEFLGNAAISSNLNCLMFLGVNQECLNDLCEWAKHRSVSLRLNVEESCTFVKEASRDVDSKHKNVTEISSGGSNLLSFSSKVVTTITEYFWRFDVVYEVIAFMGTGERQEDRRVVRKRLGRHEIITTVNETPRPKSTIKAPIDVNITWLLNHVNPINIQPTFKVDRKRSDCHTPRRNEDVKSAMKHHQDLNSWCSRVSLYFTNSLFSVAANHGLDLSSLNADTVFVPVVPLLMDKSTDILSIRNLLLFDESNEEKRGSDELTTSTVDVDNDDVVVTTSNAVREGSTVLDPSDLNLFLNEETRSLRQKCDDVAKSFPNGSTSASLITSSEGEILVTLTHLQHICQSYVDGVEYIEDLLRKQLVAAIGREITPTDLSDYMRFHNNKMFREAYAPLPFCYAVRRSESHGPEGVLSIEVENSSVGSNSNIPTPIYTVAHHEISDNSPETNMEFALSAATRVSFSGDRHLHAWLQHTFSGSNAVNLSLAAEARQFSSYILLVGRISSAREFDPKFGIIVKDKDSVRIPLNLEQIPSAKEFKDAIRSLSPEQQAFAQAFRSMQLESTLFGICVIQIKPQLEKVLKLAPDSLTKEIKLTQDLMELFIDYQIPSDLLSFGGNDASDSTARLNAVKGHVSAMQVYYYKPTYMAIYY
jgi:hypothetical protein